MSTLQIILVVALVVAWIVAMPVLFSDDRPWSTPHDWDAEHEQREREK